MFATQEIKIANATSRTNGAVGSNAIVPRVVRQYLSMFYRDTGWILDFGAGKHAAHALALIAEGYNVVAHEFGDNVNPRLHASNALELKYDLVYASNVLNVQSTKKMLRNTLKQIAGVLNEHGAFIANYPQSPRKLDLTPNQILAELREQFKTVIKTPTSSNSAPVWICLN